MNNKKRKKDASFLCEADLPAPITAIRPQKKNSDRFSLFHESSFIIGVSSDTLLKFNLKKGVEMTPFLFSKIEEKEQKSAVRDYFLRLLGRRDHSRSELKTKASRKGFDPGSIDPVLDELESKNYIDEATFAEKFASDKATIQQWGPLKIKAELLKKGIPGKMAEKTIARLTEDLELNKICVDLALKRKQHFLRESDDLKRKQKIITYLQRRGYTYDTINRSLPDILHRLHV